jgi:hypothetical protein
MLLLLSRQLFHAQTWHESTATRLSGLFFVFVFSEKSGRIGVLGTFPDNVYFQHCAGNWVAMSF